MQIEDWMKIMPAPPYKVTIHKLQVPTFDLKKLKPLNLYYFALKLSIQDLYYLLYITAKSYLPKPLMTPKNRKK